jgi:hypothetical protein
MNTSIFEQLTSTLAAAGPAVVLAELSEYLREQQRFHELFEPPTRTNRWTRHLATVGRQG